MLQLVFVAFFQAASGVPEAPAPQPPTETAQTPAASQVQPAQPREVCRRQPVTGTRLTRTVCLTPEQQQQIEDESRDLTNRAQSQMPLQGN
jgi:hypothetical protein